MRLYLNFLKEEEDWGTISVLEVLVIMCRILGSVLSKDKKEKQGKKNINFCPF